MADQTRTRREHFFDLSFKKKARCEPLRNGPTQPTQVPSELTDNDHDPDVSGHDQIPSSRADVNTA